MATNSANAYGYKLINNYKGYNQKTYNNGIFAVNYSDKILEITNVSNSTIIGKIYYNEKYIVVGEALNPAPGAAQTPHLIIAFRNSAGAWDLGMLRYNTNELAHMGASGFYTRYDSGRTVVNTVSLQYGGYNHAAGNTLKSPGKSVNMTSSVGWRGVTRMTLTGIGPTAYNGSIETNIANNSMNPYFGFK